MTWLGLLCGETEGRQSCLRPQRSGRLRAERRRLPMVEIDKALILSAMY